MKPTEFYQILPIIIYFALLASIIITSNGVVDLFRSIFKKKRIKN